jgi:hypothetical protein
MGFLQKIKFWKKKRNNNTLTKADACVFTEDQPTYMDNPLPSVFIHGSKFVNYHNADGEDIRFGWQKVERNLTSFNEKSFSKCVLKSYNNFYQAM